MRGKNNAPMVLLITGADRVGQVRVLQGPLIGLTYLEKFTVDRTDSSPDQVATHVEKHESQGLRLSGYGDLVRNELPEPHEYHRSIGSPISGTTHLV